jgi:hypothetical protein
MYKYLLTRPDIRTNKINSVLNRELRGKDKLQSQLRDAIQSQRRTLRNQRIRDTRHRQLWGKLIKDLNYELNNVRVSLAYAQTHGQTEKAAANAAYLELLTTLRDWFDSLQSLPVVVKPGEPPQQLTPSGYAKYQNQRKKFQVQNGGAHWSDWVPNSKRKPITDLFDAIPHTPKAKRRIPFQRKQRPDANMAAKTRLMGRTLKDLALAEQEQQLDPVNLSKTLKVRQIRAALDRMKDLTPSDVVPYTWHGMYERSLSAETPKKGGKRSKNETEDGSA